MREMVWCQSCKEVTSQLGGKAPKKWLPFAWGPTEEVPRHLYVFPEETPPPGDVPQELEVRKICELKGLERR